MAETVTELQRKSRGLQFAEEQLLRHGWEKGKGLGRLENGISEAIKVKVKCGKGGMGHKEGEQFSFHWWDHVFNKASSSLAVAADQGGVTMKKSGDPSGGLISNKKPRKAQQAKSMLYGSFVKSATLLSGQEQPEESTDSGSSSSEDEDQKLDLSSTTKLSDADLLKACGGRTAHKGARHGLKMSAKLARLEQQELDFLNKYSKKIQTSAASESEKNKLRHEELSEPGRDGEEDRSRKNKDSDDASTNNCVVKLKKKKRKKEPELEDGSNGDGIVEDTFTQEKTDTYTSVSKSKRKKMSKGASENCSDTDVIPPHEGDIEHQYKPEQASEEKKKKSKKSQHIKATSSSDCEAVAAEDEILDVQQREQKRKKKKKRCKIHEQENVERVEAVVEVVSKKKKK